MSGTIGYDELRTATVRQVAQFMAPGICESATEKADGKAPRHAAA